MMSKVLVLCTFYTDNCDASKLQVFETTTSQWTIQITFQTTSQKTSQIIISARASPNISPSISSNISSYIIGVFVCVNLKFLKPFTVNIGVFFNINLLMLKETAEVWTIPTSHHCRDLWRLSSSSVIPRSER